MIIRGMGQNFLGNIQACELIQQARMLILRTAFRLTCGSRRIEERHFPIWIITTQDEMLLYSTPSCHKGSVGNRKRTGIEETTRHKGSVVIVAT